MANLVSPPPPGPQRRALFGSISTPTLFPLIGDRSGLVTKGQLIPVIATIIAGIALMVSSQFHVINHFKPEDVAPLFGIHNFQALDAADKAMLQDFANRFNAPLQISWIIGGYVTCMATYFVYMLCGKTNRWWLVGGTFVVMALLIAGPLGHLAALYNSATLGDRQALRAASPAWRIIGSFVGPGTGEEIIKALPVFALAALALAQRNPLARFIGVTEPLDGILIGVASGAGFAFSETLMEYAPNQIIDLVNHAVEKAGMQGLSMGIAIANFELIRLALYRTLPEIAGHLAYSGIFGYFIGLAVLKRSQAPQLLLIGLLSAAALHGSWDAVTFSIKDPNFPGSFLDSAAGAVFSALIAVLSYAFLAACILKARKLSPMRAQNFATVYIPSPLVPPPPAGAPQPNVQVAMPQHKVAPAAKPSPAAVNLVMRIGPASFKLTSGRMIEPIELGSAGAGRGKNPIAEIAANPNDGNVLGLRNLSDRTYRVTLTGGQTVDLPKGKAVRLAPGLVIDFGGIAGSVEAG